MNRIPSYIRQYIFTEDHTYNRFFSYHDYNLGDQHLYIEGYYAFDYFRTRVTYPKRTDNVVDSYAMYEYIFNAKRLV